MKYKCGVIYANVSYIKIDIDRLTILINKKKKEIKYLKKIISNYILKKEQLKKQLSIYI